MAKPPSRLDDAHTGGGIGDIPAQPINPAVPGSGDTDPRFDSDGVETRERNDTDDPGDPRRAER